MSRATSGSMSLTLHIYRQANAETEGSFEQYAVSDISPDMSFLEMLDVLNERLVSENKEPVAFDHDCREGICGTCGLVISGTPHGPQLAATTCQLHMRKFSDGDELWIEPWRAKAFPIVRDLVVDRSAMDTIIQAGGFISVRTGAAPDANEIAIAKPVADTAMDAAACIGCGACVAACPNASAMLFVAAKVRHLNGLPQGAPEKDQRVISMVRAMDAQGFGGCSNHYECEGACPKEISVDFIAELNRELAVAMIRSKEPIAVADGER